MRAYRDFNYLASNLLERRYAQMLLHGRIGHVGLKVWQRLLSCPPASLPHDALSSLRRCEPALFAHDVLDFDRPRLDHIFRTRSRTASAGSSVAGSRYVPVNRVFACWERCNLSVDCGNDALDHGILSEFESMLRATRSFRSGGDYATLQQWPLFGPRYLDSPVFIRLFANSPVGKSAAFSLSFK